MARKLTEADKGKIFDLIVTDARYLLSRDYLGFITTLSKEEFEETKRRAKLFLEQVGLAIKELDIKHEL